MKLSRAASLLTLSSAFAARADASIDPRWRVRSLATDGKKFFTRVASFSVCEQLDAGCNVDDETVAETVDVTTDGMTAVYTDSPFEVLGFVDIKDPSAPSALGTFALPGEPTSVAVKGDYALACVNTSPDFVNPSGVLVVVDISDPSNPSEVRQIDLGGQPDSIAISPDGKFAVIAIENERDEDLGDGELPQEPPGFVVIVDVEDMDPSNWPDPVVVQMTGLNVYEPSDPEPEFVSINSDNVALVSLQENNGFALVDIESQAVADSFTSGTVTLDFIDTKEDKMIKQVESVADLPREPDGVVWIGSDFFASANEGDMRGGTRGFTIFNKDGSVAWESGNTVEHIITSIGHYPDKRSDSKGVEIENVDYAPDLKMLFVISERGGSILVYDVSDPTSPVFHQVLPSGVGPEGTKYIESRGLFLAACEKDDRGDKMRSALVIYEYGADESSYPGIQSVEDPDVQNGVPIPWGAMSGLAAGDGSTLYAVDDSAYKMSSIFSIDASSSPASLFKRTHITDANGVFAAVAPQGEFDAADLQAMINEDGTVNIDSEGIAVDPAGGFFVVSEGRGTVGDEDRPIESLNFLFKTDMAGVIEKVVVLPEEVNAIQLRFGFEGVAAEGDYVVVAFQRAWGDDTNPRIGLYNTVDESWKFLFYPLDEPESQNGGWVGLSDITALGDGKFLVLERDNQGGPDAAIKRIYSIDLGDLSAAEDGSLIEKTLVRDLMSDLKATGGQTLEKLEGMALLDNEVWIMNDNDAVDDNSGETQLMNLGGIISADTAPAEPSTEVTDPPAGDDTDSTEDTVEEVAVEEDAVEEVEEDASASLGVALYHSIFVAFVAVLVSLL